MMPKERYNLIYPKDVVSKPILFDVSIACRVSPSVLKANITSDGGEMLIILDGEDENIKKALSMFQEQGVRVEVE